MASTITMPLFDLITSSLHSLSQASEYLEDSIVYIDSGCSESFQFVGAFPTLVDLGVRAVCSLECMNPLDSVVSWRLTDDPARKIVVLTSRLLTEAHRYIIRCLTTHQSVRRCTILTSVSEVAHSAYPDSPLGPDAFHEYESLLLQDYEELVNKREIKSGESEFEDQGWPRLTSSEDDSVEATSSGKGFYEDDSHVAGAGQKLMVSVLHFPMILCPFSPRVFVLPSDGSVAEANLSSQHDYSLSPGLPSISTGVPLDGDEVPPGALLTAHFLYHLAAKMDLKLDIFSYGDLSKTVGKIMTDMSSLYDVGRRKRSAGLLLIDRTLDLLTPCCHGDSLVDRLFLALSRRKRAASSFLMKGQQSQTKVVSSRIQRDLLNVQIPLAKILREEESEVYDSRLSESIEAFLVGWDNFNSASKTGDLIEVYNKIRDEKSILCEDQLLTGSFVSSETFRGTPYLEALLDRKMKDGAVLVKKWLQEILRRENVTANVKSRPGFVSTAELRSMIKTLAKSQSSLIRNKGIIQLAAAVLEAQDESCSERWDAFISAEKILMASAGDTSQSLAAQIGDILNKSVLAGSGGQMSRKNEHPQGLLSFTDALLLMIVGYILAGENFPTSGTGGPFSWQEEHFLKEAIVDLIFENPSIARLEFLHGLREELEANIKRKLSKETTEASEDKLLIDDFDDDQWAKWGEEEEDNKNEDQSYNDMQLKLELRDRVDNLFKLFHKLSALQRRNVPLRDGPFSTSNSFSGDLDSNKGLLYKLLTRLLAKNDIPGLEYHSSTVGRIFKSGFGRFGLGQTKPSLADQNTILVFVIGGINATEVIEMQEALSESGRPDVELVIGGTTLLTPHDMFDLLVGRHSYL